MKYDMETDVNGIGNILNHIQRNIKSCKTPEELSKELNKIVKMVNMIGGNRIEDYLNIIGAGEAKNFEDIDKMLTGKWKE